MTFSLWPSGTSKTWFPCIIGKKTVKNGNYMRRFCHIFICSRYLVVLHHKISRFHVTLTCMDTLLASNSAFPCNIILHVSSRCTSSFQYTLSLRLQSIPLFSTLTLCNLLLPHLQKLDRGESAEPQ